MKDVLEDDAAAYEEGDEIVMADGGPGTEYEDTPEGVVASDQNVMQYAQEVANAVENVTARGEIEINAETLGQKMAADKTQHFEQDRYLSTEHHPSDSQAYEFGVALGAYLEEATEDVPGTPRYDNITGQVVGAAGEETSLIADHKESWTDNMMEGVQDAQEYLEANNLEAAFEAVGPEEQNDNRVTQGPLERIDDDVKEKAKTGAAAVAGAGLAALGSKLLDN